MTRLTRDVIDYQALTESVLQCHCGGVVLFLGTVRDLTGDHVTAYLTYDAYAPMAEKKLAEIEAEIRQKWAIGDIAIVHRLGWLEVREVSVAIAISTPHRKEAFAACQYAIERLKQIVPIWKKDYDAHGNEIWVSGSSQ